MLINTLQWFILKEIINYNIKNNKKLYLYINRQLLLYLCKKKGIRKSFIVKVLEIEFIFLNQWEKLVISTLTRGCAIILAEFIYIKQLDSI